MGRLASFMPPSYNSDTMGTLFQIKICGVTSVADAQLAAEVGADAIGLNFYPASKRNVAPERAAEIAAALPASIARVGVFVNSPAAEIRRIAELTPLDWVQLHGDEPAEILDELNGLAVIRALRLGLDSWDDVGQVLAPWIERADSLGALLIDAHVPGEYGGTGARAPWGRLQPPRAWAGGLPVILAGGLQPSNVAEAIATTQAEGVDTASGVERSPGAKDPRLVREFVAAARAAYSARDASS
ncbi:MAG: phosphoribosylanthranilate isomerase [Planctomycetales bacterium]|nr:phosphoribosylanthranilate isomerase [Planctomycetales bacterium]